MTARVSSLLPAAGSGEIQPRDAKEAAAQFESLLIAQMLKGMRESGASGWLGTGDDESGACMVEMAEEHLASVLSAQGGLGLASIVMRGLGPEAAARHGGSSPAPGETVPGK